MSLSRSIVLAIILYSAAAAPAAETAPRGRTLEFALGPPPTTGQPPAVTCVVPFGPALPISAVAISADGKWLAVGAYQEVLLWDLSAATLARRIGMGQLAGMVHALVFLDAGKRLAVGDGQPEGPGSVKVFGLPSGGLAAAFSEPKGSVQCLAASPDGLLLVAGDGGSAVHVWNLADGKLLKTLSSHRSAVLGVAFDSQSRRLATGSADRTMVVWDVATWDPTVRYELPATVHAVAMSPDGNTVLGAVGGPGEWAIRVGRIDQDIEQAARRKPIARPMPTATGMPLDVVWPSGANHVFVACHDQTIRAYQAGGGRLLTNYQGHGDWVYCVAATSDGTKLATGGADGTVKLWDGAGGRPIATFVQLAPGTDQWLIMTRGGHFAASSVDVVTWKATDPSLAPEELTRRYHKPDLVRQALAAATSVPSAFRRNPGANPGRPRDPAKQGTRNASSKRNKKQ